jgi:formate hydrogenlyase subunit 3/multisubunit Na+/H+ antiporter MnhD subunit
MAAFAAAGALASSPSVWALPWSLAGGGLRLRLDALAALFLLPVAVVGGLCAVYGVAYLRRHAHGRPVARSLAAYDLLLASMALVVTADDLLLLIVAWELMTLSSWALVATDHEDAQVRGAGLQYLVASHLATGALLLLAVALVVGTGSFAIGPPGERALLLPAGAMFLLALVGFGTKAGIVPLHVWLPDAHPAAPSHVSALMSAVMVTMGFYGLARFLPLLGPPPLWWAYSTLVLGASGAFGGVLFALAQRDVKRILAYSTVENAGIVTTALGLGVLGGALGDPLLAGLGWTAALLHVWNHALAKAALFLGFGAVAQAVGSRSLDALGGMLARWRLVGGTLVLTSAAIASLPGLNVFASEWLLLRGLLAGGFALDGVTQAVLLGVLVVLALTGALAVACFVRIVGVGLLGSTRSASAPLPSRPSAAMWAPMLVLAAGCVAIGAAPGAVARVLAGAVAIAAPGADAQAASGVLAPLALLLPLIAGSVAIVLAVRLATARAGRSSVSDTWGCGYPSPTPVMQYSSSSFSEPITRVLEPVLKSDARMDIQPGGRAAMVWPTGLRWTSRTADRALASIFLPAAAGVARAAAWLRKHHRQRVTTSVLYIVLTAVALLALLFLPGRM